MRLAVLYLRSRSAAAALAVAVGTAAGLWWIAQAVDDPDLRRMLALFAALAGTAAMAPGLAGADVDLERTAGLAWLPRRGAHVILAGALVLGLLVSLAQAGDQLARGAVIARDVAGLTGLVALGAATIGATRAWLPPAVWTLVSLWYMPPFATPPHAHRYQVMLTWMVQPTDARPATVAAVVLATAGTLAYALRGPARN